MRLTRPLMKMSRVLTNPHIETSLELDSHEDTTVIEADTLTIQNYDRPVEVVGYDPQQGLQTLTKSAEFPH